MLAPVAFRPLALRRGRGPAGHLPQGAFPHDAAQRSTRYPRSQSVGDLWRARGDIMTNVIDTLAAGTKRDDGPVFRAGGALKVHVKGVEGNRSRVQVFQG